MSEAKIAFSVINETKSELMLNPGTTVADAITLICGSGVCIDPVNAVICLQRNGARIYGNIGHFILQESDILWVSDRRIDTPVTDLRDYKAMTAGFGKLMDAVAGCDDSTGQKKADKPSYTEQERHDVIIESMKDTLMSFAQTMGSLIEKL